MEAKAKASEALKRVARERYERTLVDCFLRIEAERAKVESRADELVGLIKRRHAVVTIDRLLYSAFQKFL